MREKEGEKEAHPADKCIFILVIENDTDANNNNKCCSPQAYTLLYRMASIEAIKNIILYSRTHRRIPIRRTVTIHIFRACISRFNICFLLFQVLLRPQLHFYWPFVLWLNYGTLWHRWIISLSGFAAILISVILFCSRHNYQLGAQEYLEIIQLHTDSKL